MRGTSPIRGVCPGLRISTRLPQPVAGKRNASPNLTIARWLSTGQPMAVSFCTWKVPMTFLRQTSPACTCSRWKVRGSLSGFWTAETAAARSSHRMSIGLPTHRARPAAVRSMSRAFLQGQRNGKYLRKAATIRAGAERGKSFFTWVRIRCLCLSLCIRSPTP